jgi:geranylgeranyl pyrophosphate synthase
MGVTEQRAVMDMLDYLSARDYAQSMASRHLRLAVGALEATRMENQAQESLREIAHFLLERQY